MTNANTTNDVITDAVTQNMTLLTGTAAPQGMAMIDVVSAETLGMAMHNAISAQQNAQLTTNASITTTCAKMLGIQPPVPEPTPKAEVPPFMKLGPDSPQVSGKDNSALMDKINAIKDALTKIDTKGESTADVEAGVQSITKQLDAMKAFITEQSTNSASAEPSHNEPKPPAT
ncbi:RebB family R body protein [Paraferrimonas sp. SM1919]|uniref:RebB family R body protein n=1 Tax=Paraferrimonas sp. SM1919 TaxID=2662263 RepID=UPI0013D8CC50|nr:RebB family R body protein [Paraferrimonas sp. SM1919]